MTNSRDKTIGEIQAIISNKVRVKSRKQQFVGSIYTFSTDEAASTIYAKIIEPMEKEINQYTTGSDFEAHLYYCPRCNCIMGRLDYREELATLCTKNELLEKRIKVLEGTKEQLEKTIHMDIKDEKYESN